jgi:phage-related minor tail protein
MSEVAVNFSEYSTDMTSMGEAFNEAIKLFDSSNDKLIENLARIEESMDKSSARSDEQMGYYVSQAREIIDQSMLSQKEIIDELRSISRRESLADEAS